MNMNHIHLIGIGGSGMSGIAKLLLQKGYTVSGSDISLNSTTERLENLGATIYKGHRKENIKNDVDLIVISSAIKENNEELMEARRRGIKIITRGEMLSLLMRNKKGIAIAGTHGKTTTTTMIALILDKNNLAPTIYIGGDYKPFNGNAKLGEGNFFVTETDESDNSFLYLSPYIEVITNIEADHLEYHKDLHGVINAFLQFIDRLKEDGFLVLCKDNINIKRILPTIKKPYFTYGIKEKDCNIKAKNIQLEKDITHYELIENNEKLGKIYLKVPGIHNVYNSLAAYLTCSKIGLTFVNIKEALYSFTGVNRRFEIKLQKDNLLIVDDYAHHPTEIKAVLLCAKQLYKKRVICIFQPHRYTRTYYLLNELVNSFSNVDKLIITDIYSAGEPKIRGVSAKKLYELIKKNKKEIVYLPRKDDIIKYVLRIMKKDDLIITIGAGDIYKVSEKLTEELKI